MKLSPQWLREFVDIPVGVSNAQLASDLTLAGTAVENTDGDGAAMLFEMEITTNRPDAMNHYGVAREASAVYDVALTSLTPKLPATNGSTSVTIAIEDADGCARYTGRVIRGVKIGPSPESVAKRLTNLGHRAINNAADATNYTLWEMGHPTHAFDLDKLAGEKIIVRRAREGETLKTLDGIERTLTGEDLVIADAEKPVALAGVMGGFDSMITESTKNILIEAAWFEPVTIRKMAKRHGMHTDASHRFERGADWGATPVAAARVAERILNSADGMLQGDAIDCVARTIKCAPIALRRTEVRRILGQEFSADEITRILSRLGFVLTPTDDGFMVHIPSWRLDVEREVDLIEEIARIHGYDKFANTLPPYVGAVVELPDAEKEVRTRATLLALGYHETISLTFISAEDAKTFARDTAPPLALANPLSAEASMMRNSMVPGMLGMLAYNLNRGAETVRLFEAGHIFASSAANGVVANGKVVEAKSLALGATGQAQAAGVYQTARAYSFFDLKGDVESLLAPFEWGQILFEPQTTPYYHPGRSACVVMDGIAVAQFGQIHPEVAAARKIRQEVFVAEVFLDQLYQLSLRDIRYTALPRFPAVQRDFSFLLPETTDAGFEQLRGAVIALAIPELREFLPVEVLGGGSVASVPVGKKSMLLRAIFQSAERTLREQEVAQWSERIVAALQSLGGALRS